MSKLNFYIIFFSIFIFSFCKKETNQNIKTTEFKNVNHEEAGYNINESPIEYKLVNMRSKLKIQIKKKYNQEITEIIKGTSGGATLYEALWILNLINDGKITDPKEIESILTKTNKILIKLKDIKAYYKDNDIWGVGFEDIDPMLLSKDIKTKQLSIEEKKEKLKTFYDSLKSKLDANSKRLIDKIYKTFLDIDAIKVNSPKDPSTFKKFKHGLKANYMLLFILKRGILTLNKHWWEITDKLLKDKSGVIAYHDAKKDFKKPIAPVTFFGKTINVVGDNNFLTQILKLSLGPSKGVFGVGEVKESLFHPFMPKNVGRSYGKEWRSRRKVNDKVLCFDRLHDNAKIYNDYIKEFIQKRKEKNNLPTKGVEFFNSAKQIVTKIVFGDDKKVMPHQIFDMLDKANSMTNILNNNYKISDDIMNPVKKYFKENIDNPKSNSFVELAVKNKKLLKHCPYMDGGSKCSDEEISNQIPHWIFPLMKDLFATLPRTMLLICNHPKVFKKLKAEIKKIDADDPKAIYECKYLRYCIMEMLRLNSTVITMLRRLNKNYCFDLRGRYCYKKGDQFLILTNSVNREPEKFKKPNKFIPSRWNKDLEDSHYAIMFGQGPQKCPGKEIGIFVVASYIAHYLKAFDFKITSNKVNTEYIEQMYNPTKIEFYPYNQKIST